MRARVMTEPLILGIAASPHNGAVCLMRGDEILAAVQEERVTRRKWQGIAAGRPSAAVTYCLRAAGVTDQQLDLIVVCTQAPRASAARDVWRNPQLEYAAAKGRVAFISHHYGHALSVWAWSGLRDAAVLVADGLGSPWEDLPREEQRLGRAGGPGLSETVSGYHASGEKLIPLTKVLVPPEAWLRINGLNFPSFGSLGGFYSAFAHQIFGDALEAGKVMGLSPYGNPTLFPKDLLVSCDGELMFPNRVPTALDSIRKGDLASTLTRAAAASAQLALETVLLELAGDLRARTKEHTLCFAGGVALNAIANERLLRESGFRTVSVIPAADDAGTAFGAAIHGLLTLDYPVRPIPRVHDYLGRKYTDQEITDAATCYPDIEGSRPVDLPAATAELLANGKIGGWCQGGSEFGPRALGARSILADPRWSHTKLRLDKSIKRREPFRPYAPMVLASKAATWFDLGPQSQSPFMLRVVSVLAHQREKIPAVVHIDGSARLQTVGPDDGAHSDLLARFDALTGIPVLLNTSFNGFGEPIVETPGDAFAHFLNSELDFCVFDRWLFRKKMS